jgi:hypothetical protein
MTYKNNKTQSTRCIAKTNTGYRCKCHKTSSSTFCSTHTKQKSHFLTWVDIYLDTFLPNNDEIPNSSVISKGLKKGFNFYITSAMSYKQPDVASFQ